MSDQSNAERLERLAFWLQGKTGRSWGELRHVVIKRWVAKLTAAEATEYAAVRTLLDIATVAPEHYPGWSPVSAIDSMVAEFVRNAGQKPDAAEDL